MWGLTFGIIKAMSKLGFFFERYERLLSASAIGLALIFDSLTLVRVDEF